MYKKGAGALQRKVKPAAEADEKNPDGIDQSSSGFRRMQSDFAMLELPANCKIVHKDPDKPDLMNFSIIVTATDGHWEGGQFEFSWQVPKAYPIKEPKVRCVDKIYHPNIDLEGAICVNILRPWKPVYTLQLILFALLFLLAEPNASDPLNKDAARVLREDPAQFVRNVKSSLRGQTVDGVRFDRNRGFIGKP